MLARFWRYPFQQTGFNLIPATSLPTVAFRSSSFFPSNRQNAFAFVSRTIVNYERTGGRTEDRFAVEIGRVRRAEDESDRCCSNDDTSDDETISISISEKRTSVSVRPLVGLHGVQDHERQEEIQSALPLGHLSQVNQHRPQIQNHRRAWRNWTQGHRFSQ